MNFLGIIPARYKSSRLPGKPLKDILGKPMLQHVYQRAIQAMNNVVIATDDQRIYNCAESFGAPVVMTSKDHPNGSSRCKEALELFEKNTKKHFDTIINIQGDEPMLNPSQIKELKDCVEKSKDFQIATLVKKITTIDSLFNPSECYVVFNTKSQALYFSRATIPFIVNVSKEKWLEHHDFYKHVGIYAYSRDSLKTITTLPQSPLEQAESLEQNRWIEHGGRIHVGITTHETLCVDTQKDLDKVIAEMAKQNNI